MENPARQVPDDLLEKLHKATDHFHDSKEGLENALDKPEYEHQHRVDTAGEELRKAEGELEDVEKQIKDVLPNQE
jgi:polyhydroxyalkanoate synthesis regulator phasin